MINSFALFKPSSIWKTQSKLGEGVVWIESEEVVYFVDIEGKKICRYSIENDQKKEWNCEKKPTFVFPTNRSVFLCGMEDGLYWFEPFNGEIKKWIPFEEQYFNNRINDGYIDAKGRLWFSSMDIEEQQLTGALYLLDWENNIPYIHKKAGGEYAVLNGPVINEEKQILYCSHSNAHEIYSFHIKDGKELVDRKLFVQEEEGFPDGMALDSENNLWVCLYQGYKINVYSPDGVKVNSIDFPCPNLTKIAFGGKDLKTAFVTSAREKTSENQLSNYQQAGNLFTFDTIKKGKNQNIFYIPVGILLEK